MGGVVDRLEEPVPPVHHPVATGLGRRVAGPVGRRRGVRERADPIGPAAADRHRARADTGEAVTGRTGGGRDGAEGVEAGVHVDPVTATTGGRPATGLVIGRFLPPHLGHSHLIETAAGSVRWPYVRLRTASEQRSL